MQEYTSLETSKQLYEMFGWSDTPVWFGNGDTSYIKHSSYGVHFEANDAPAYSLPYLLDKLPDSMHSLAYEVTYRLTMKKIDNSYFVEYSNHAWFRNMKSVFARKGYDTSDELLAYGIKPICSNTPVEAAALLCLELGKQGILPRKDK